MSKYNRKKGFTLIELIVVIAILSIVMVMGANFFHSSLKISTHENALNELQSDGRVVLNAITQDIRTASIISPANIGCIMSFKSDAGNIDYKYDSETYVLSRKGIVIANDIKTITLTTEATNSNICNIYITTQKKNFSETFNLASSITLGNVVAISVSVPVVIPAQTPYTSLANFEKNMLNIVGTSAEFTIGTNNTFNPTGSILMQGNSLSLNGMGNNLNGNIAIRANALNLGNGNTGTSSGEAVFDVNSFTGSLASYNSSFYVHDLFQGIHNNWNKIENYKGTFWSYLFANPKDGTTIPMSVRTLNTNIDFSDISVNPTLNVSKIHYINGTSSNKITDNKLPDYRGNISSVGNVNSGNYEYIICHGPLIINTTDPNNGSFDFRGIIYCDDVVTFNDMGSSFKGIIIAKGLKALNVIGSQNHNWNISFDNNSNSLTEINAIINKITTGS